MLTSPLIVRPVTETVLLVPIFGFGNWPVALLRFRLTVSPDTTPESAAELVLRREVALRVLS